MSDPLPDPRLRRDALGVVFTRAVVPGHALLARGQAYLAVDCYLDRCSTNLHATIHQENGAASSVAGWGHGVCSCGVSSPHVLYGADRRWWHRQHKARVILGQPEPAGQPAPVRPEEIAR